MVNALVIVAHPDDETIWCGGTILMHPGWQWAIISLCRKDDKDRAPKFRKACKKLGAKCAMSGLDDERPEKELPSLDGVKERIKGMLAELKSGNSFDIVFTHGAEGEYGHNRHKEVHRAVQEMVASGELHAKEIYFFNYKLSKRGFFCEPSERDASVNTRLNAQIAQSKRLLITSCYEFSKGSFEERSARSIESFRVIATCDQ